MKICLIAEGSYPYVTGGVSSWIQMLIESLPEYEFYIYTIGAQRELEGKFKYEIPKNVIHIYENFLDDYKSIKSKWGKDYNIQENIFDAIKNLICSQKVNWECIFDYVSKGNFDNVVNFLMSKDLFEIIKEAGMQNYLHVPFNDLYWTVRAMVLPLFSILNKEIPKADVYHTVSTGYAGIIGSYAKYIHKKPLILTEHGIYSREREEEIIKADWVKGEFKDMWIQFFYSLSKNVYIGADKVVTLFNRNKHIQIELGCQGEKIDIIPNGIDASKYQFEKSSFEYLNNQRSTADEKENNENQDDNKKVNIDSNLINIGAIVRIVPIKDIKTMIQGFYTAKEEVKNLKLYIMGPTEEDEEYFSECLQLVESLDVKDIQFTGRINVSEYLPKMDFMLLTSISEGQPFALLEAMASKKTTIATDVGCCRELLEEANDEFGQAGIIVPILDNSL